MTPRLNLTDPEASRVTARSLERRNDLAGLQSLVDDQPWLGRELALRWLDQGSRVFGLVDGKARPLYSAHGEEWLDVIYCYNQGPLRIRGLRVEPFKDVGRFVQWGCDFAVRTMTHKREFTVPRQASELVFVARHVAAGVISPRAVKRAHARLMACPEEVVGDEDYYIRAACAYLADASYYAAQCLEEFDIEKARDACWHAESAVRIAGDGYLSPRTVEAALCRRMLNEDMTCKR